MVTFSYQTSEMDLLNKFIDPSISNIMNWPDISAHINLCVEIKKCPTMTFIQM